MRRPIWDWLKALSAPRRALPILLSLVLILAAVGLSDLSSVLDRGHLLQPATFVITAALAAVYLAAKGWQFRRLLTASGLETHWRSRWLAFVIGEMSLTLPFGVYSSNYVLQKAQGIHFADSAATTTLMIALEASFLVAVLAVIPIPEWPQLQLILWGFIGIGVLVLLRLLIRDSHHPHKRLKQRARRTDWTGTLAREVLHFMRRARVIGRPYVLLHNIAFTVIYMLALTSAFYFVGEDISKAFLGFPAAITIYAFGLLVAMLLGSLLSQLGVLEFSGAAAAQAWGLSFQGGLAILLWFRLLWTVTIWILCGIIIATLWRELSRITAKDYHPAHDHPPTEHRQTPH